MRNFQEALDLCGLKDLSYMGEMFTWANKQGETGFIHERLDMYVGSIKWLRFFPNSHIHNLPFYNSDHRAIRVNLSSSFMWVRKEPGGHQRRRFHFEEVWASDEECRNIILSSWGVNNSQIEVKKSNANFGSCVKEINDLEAKLETLLTQDEVYWRQRSRVDWLAHGDHNSKIFHQKAGHDVAFGIFIEVGGSSYEVFQVGFLLFPHQQAG
ncbi:hypothetical protein UlMin_023212 [Ulmus minor]